MNLELFECSVLIKTLEIDSFKPKKMFAYFQFDEMPKRYIGEFDLDEGKNRIKLHKGIKFIVRVNCLLYFKKCPFYIYFSNVQSQTVCACGFDFSPLIVDAFRHSSPDNISRETYQSWLLLQNRYDQKIGSGNFKFTCRHFSADISRILDYEVPEDESQNTGTQELEEGLETLESTHAHAITMTRKSKKHWRPIYKDLLVLTKKYQRSRSGLVNEVDKLENSIRRIEARQKRKVHQGRQERRRKCDGFEPVVSESSTHTSDFSYYEDSSDYSNCEKTSEILKQVENACGKSFSHHKNHHNRHRPKDRRRHHINKEEFPHLNEETTIANEDKKSKGSNSSRSSKNDSGKSKQSKNDENTQKSSHGSASDKSSVASVSSKKGESSGKSKPSSSKSHHSNTVNDVDKKHSKTSHMQAVVTKESQSNEPPHVKINKDSLSISKEKESKDQSSDFQFVQDNSTSIQEPASNETISKSESKSQVNQSSYISSSNSKGTEKTTDEHPSQSTIQESFISSESSKNNVDVTNEQHSQSTIQESFISSGSSKNTVEVTDAAQSQSTIQESFISSESSKNTVEVTDEQPSQSTIQESFISSGSSKATIEVTASQSTIETLNIGSDSSKVPNSNSSYSSQSHSHHSEGNEPSASTIIDEASNIAETSTSNFANKESSSSKSKDDSTQKLSFTVSQDLTDNIDDSEIIDVESKVSENTKSTTNTTTTDLSKDYVSQTKIESISNIDTSNFQDIISKESSKSSGSSNSSNKNKKSKKGKNGKSSKLDNLNDSDLSQLIAEIDNDSPSQDSNQKDPLDELSMSSELKHELGLSSSFIFDNKRKDDKKPMQKEEEEEQHINEEHISEDDNASNPMSELKSFLGSDMSGILSD